ncbi:MAG: SIMPL domain-containing protein [Verrucomicrobia bacterium]|nr:SIMPL domain-containing protein [Verrucomicrobiota bacterium]
MRTILSISLVLLGTAPAFSSGLPDRPYIYTVGNAEMSVDPDRAVIEVSLKDTNLEQAKAKAKVATSAKRVFDVLKAIQVPQTDVSSHDVSVRPESEWTDRNRVFKGYEVTQQLRIEVKQIDKYAELVNRLIDTGVAEMRVVEVFSSKREEIERELTTQAINDAKRRATDIAVASGAQIQSVYAVSPIPFGTLQDEFLGRRGFSEAPAAAGGGAPPLELQIGLPKVHIRKSMNVIFTIEKKP